jgi:hypothetical protein
VRLAALTEVLRADLCAMSVAGPRHLGWSIGSPPESQRAIFRGSGFDPSGTVAASVVSTPAGGADHDTDKDGNGNLVENEGSPRGEEGDGAKSSISSAEIEAQLKPRVIAIFDAITDIHKNLHWLQDERIAAMHKREVLSLDSERRYHKLKFESIQLAPG